MDQTIALKSPLFLSNTLACFAMALLISFLGTATGLWLFSFVPEIVGNPFIFGLAMIAELILVFTARSWSQKVPFGYAVFSLFSFLSGFTLVPILLMAGAVGGIPMVMKALFSSVCVFLAAALYGWTTHRSLLGLRGFLFISLIGLLVISLLGIFFPWGSSMEIAVSAFGILIFAGFTMVDIQNLKTSSVENPLLAAITLYLNFINLFVSILRLMMALRGRD